jgi:hypothetical protein
MRRSVIILIILFQICLAASGQVNLQEGLIAHYPFNGNLNDKSGNGYDLTANGGEFTTDRFGNISAYKFNNTSEYLVTNTVLSSFVVTISFWFYLNGFPPVEPGYRWGILQSDYSIYCQSDSIVAVGYPGNLNTTNSNFKLHLNKWYHLVVIGTYEMSKLYINDTLTSQGGRLPWGVDTFLNIGTGDWTKNFLLNGKIDDIRIYQRQLNEQEINELYTRRNEIDPLIINTNHRPISICKSFPEILKANKDNNLTYQWFKGDSVINGAASDTVVITEPGTYRVKETDQYGNTDISKSQLVSSFSIIKRDIISICGENANLYALTNYTGSDTLNYLWGPSDGLDDANSCCPITYPTASKEYSVTITTNKGCFVTDSVNVIVEPLVALANDTTIRCSTDAQLNVSTNYKGSNALFYNWTPATYLNNPHIRNPIAIKPKSTVYTVEVATFNGCNATKKIWLSTDNYKVPYSGLLSNYPFKGNVNDQSGNGYNLSTSGGTYSTDRFGDISAYELNGTDDYLQTDSIFKLSSCSISFWVNMKEFPSNNNQEFVFLGIGGTTNNNKPTGFGIHYQIGGVVIKDYMDVQNSPNFSYTLLLNKWYHFVVVYRFTLVSYPLWNPEYRSFKDFDLYINDSLRINFGFRVGQPTYRMQSFQRGYLQIGSMKYSSDSVRKQFFSGKIDDVMLYDRALSEQDIHGLYMDKKPNDLNASICLVSVNESDRNFVTWQKYQNAGIDSVYIYRETPSQTGQFDLIGKVSYSSPGLFIDSLSNAKIKANKYALSYIDNCGYESKKSPEQKTMYLTMNKGVGFDWNLQWEPYSGIPVETYNIYRGTTKSDLTYIGSVPGSITSFTDVDAPSGIVYYQVRIDLPMGCLNPDQPEFTGSGSNIVSNSDLKETDLILDNAIFYPNPADDIIYIRRCNSDKALLNIYNLDGKLLISKQLTNDGNTMDISVLNPGAYMVRLDDAGVSSRKILIKK